MPKKKSTKLNDPTLNPILLVAKIWSGLSIAFMLFFIGGHIFSPDENSTNILLVELVAMLFFPVGILIGLAWSWKNALRGAQITIVSLFIFFLLIAFPRGVALGMLPIMFLISGSSLLFLYVGLKLRKSRR